MWDKILYIDGTVYTGEVNAEFVNPISSDPAGQNDPDEYGCWAYDDPTMTNTWLGNLRSKNVGTTEWELSADKQTLTITVTNGYPCYYGSVAFYAKNTGSVPVITQSVTLTKNGDWDRDGDGVEDVTVLYDGAYDVLDVGYQLDPGKGATGAVWVHVEQTDPEFGEKQTYTFDLDVHLVQWNEFED
jgi:hypothetical protein